MDRNYIKFIIAYDFCKTLEDMELACDEAFELAEEIANRYIKYTEENGIDQYYDTLYGYCEEISFKDIWKEITQVKMDEMRKRVYTKETLLDVIGSYLRQIKLNGKEYPTVVLADLESSMKYVLRVNQYDGKYKEDIL